MSEPYLLDEFYYDSGNDEGDGYEDQPPDINYVSHAFRWGRKDSKLFELKSGRITLQPFDGDFTEIYQIVTAQYMKNNVRGKLTFGMTQHQCITNWLRRANYQGRYGIKHPILCTDVMNLNAARKYAIANLVKVMARRAMRPTHIREDSDCTGALTDSIVYILRKLAEIIPSINRSFQQSIFRYADRKGYKVVAALGGRGPQVVPK